MGCFMEKRLKSYLAYMEKLRAREGELHAGDAAEICWYRSGFSSMRDWCI